MDFRILGALEVRDRWGQLVPLGGHKQRTLLALLLLDRNEPVAVDRLVSKLWSDVPGSGRHAVHLMVHRLRRVLAAHDETDRIATSAAGYVLVVEDGELDADRFESLLEDARGARAAGRLADAVSVCDEALALWHGPALAELPTGAFARPAIARLEALQLAAAGERAMAMLAQGRHTEVTASLEELTRLHPTREQLARLLMTALYRSGRQADALDAFHATRQALLDQHGREPGRELRELQRAILVQDPALAAPATTRPPAAVPDASPRAPAGAGVEVEGVAGAAPPAPEEAERRVITALAARLVWGAPGAGRDAEELWARHTWAVARVRAEVERLGGAVHSGLGETVMGTFGARRTHRDDPARAVRAALAVRTALSGQEHLTVSVGIDTGEAVVAPGDGGHAPTVTGEVAHTAVELAAAAPAGGVLVGAGTYRPTAHAIGYRPAAPGPAGPAWHVVGDGGGHPTGAAVAMVGREEELSLLAGLVDRVRSEPGPQLVTIVGVPGVGKTRLVHELRQRLDERPDPPAWYQGRSLPYGDGVTYWALSEIVAGRAGISATDSVEEAGRKLRGTVAETPEMVWTSEYLERLVRPEGAVDDAGWQRQAFTAWRRFFEAAAGEPPPGDQHQALQVPPAAVRPLVLVFEDAHWADDAMLDFVEHLADHSERAPLLVVCVAWPELLERRPAWDGGKPNGTTLTLAPLSGPQTELLLDRLLDAEAIPVERRAQLLAGSGGNPLFIEEYVRALRGRFERDRALGLEPGVLVPPETLRLLIGARLDDLEPADRALLADAAVLGETVWVGALASISGRTVTEVAAALHRLTRREFLRRVPRSSLPGEAEYRFGHVLIRDVAYARLLRGNRADRHRLAAVWLSQLGAGRGDHAELTAHHYQQAVTYLHAAGRGDPGLTGQAALALRQAGDRAAALAAGRAALRYYTQALELWPQDAAGRPELLLDREALRMELEEQADQANLTAAYDGLLRSGDQVRAAKALSLSSATAWLTREPAAAARYERAARELLDRAAASPEKTKVLAGLANNVVRLSRYAEARALGAEVVSLAKRFGLPTAEAWGLSAVGAGRVVAGDAAGLDDLRQAAAMLTERRSALALNAHVYLSTAAAYTGDFATMRASRDAIGERIEQFQATGFRFWLGVMDAGWFFLSGEWDRTVEVADAWIAELSASGAHYMDGAFRHYRAKVALARGQVDAALADAEAAYTLSRGADEHAALSTAAGYGSTLLTTGRDPEGVAARIAADLSGRIAGRMLTPASGADLPYLLATFGRVPELAGPALRGSPWLRAIRAYGAGRPEDAADVYARIGAPAEEALARLHAGERLAGEGRTRDAAGQLTRARAFYETVGARFYLRRIESLLASAPPR